VANEPFNNCEVLITVTNGGNEVVVCPFEVRVTASTGVEKVDSGSSVMVLVIVELGEVCVTTSTEVDFACPEVALPEVT